MSQSSLKLFGCVPTKAVISGEPILLKEYGVLVAGEAAYDIRNIRKYLKDTGVGTNELNSAFYQGWKKIEGMSDFEMLCDQLVHYFSTYGLEYFGVDSVRDGYVYIPDHVVNDSLPVVLKVIIAEDSASLIKRCFGLLNSGMALEASTVKDIVDILEECDYVITGNEEIKNKEAQVRFYQVSGKLPIDSSKLFRYLVFHFSDSTLVINDQKTMETIKSSGKVLPYLSSERMISLSQTFNRYKKLWMCIKKAHPSNIAVVNRLTKLSKNHHIPMKDNPLNLLTSKNMEISIVKDYARNATIFQLVRAVNALRLRQSLPNGSVYKIRNGRSWTTASLPAPLVNKDYHNILIEEIMGRFKNLRVFCDPFVDFPIPTSEKSFIGNIPASTIIRFKKSDKTVLVGVHWEDQYTDLDLRADSADQSVGWNTGLRSRSRCIMHSGDMTRAPAPYGASEWIYFGDLDSPYNLKLNLFRGDDFSSKFKFIVGASTKQTVEEGYILPASDVIFSCEMPMLQQQLSIGMIYPEGDKICLLIGVSESGKGRIGKFSELDIVRQDVSTKQTETALRLKDIVTIVDSPQKSTVDLSLSNLTKDSFLGMMK